MQNVVVNMCEKFHNDRLRNGRALGNRKSDNNKKTNNYNVRSASGPVSGSEKSEGGGYISGAHFQVFKF